MSYGASSDDWLNFDLLGLTKDLLPVVSNPTAPVSPKSSLKQIGKVPSRYNSARQIVGIPDWTQHQSTAKELERWSKEPDYGICIQTRHVRALDIDVTNASEAQTIVEFISGRFNWLGFPCRLRANSSKCLLGFVIKGEFPKRVMKTQHGIIEFLANGQQFIAIGTHPSGARYEWDWADHKAFPEISIDEFESLWSALVKEFAIEPPSESSLRNTLSGGGVIAALNDDVAQYLGEEGYVIGVGKEGQIFLRCPFEAEHSEQIEGGTSTAYLPKGNRQYEQGHFACLHAHCSNRPDEEFLDAISYRIKDFDILPDEPESVTTRKRFEVIAAGDFIKRPRAEWIIKGVIPQGSLMLIYGGSGDGKTFATMDMFLAVARGVEWNGRRVKQGRIVYVCAEDADGVSLRLDAYCRQNNIEAHALPFGFIPDTPNFREMKDVKIIAESALAFGKANIIVIDTLAQVTPGADENTGKDMSVVLRNCQELHRLTGALVCLVHHAGKDESKGARGWSGLKAPLDAQLQVSREGENRKIWVEKLKNGRDGFGWDFKLEVINLYEDADGDIVDSCIVKYTANTTSIKVRKGTKPIRRLGRNQEPMWQLFHELGGGGEVLHARLLDSALSRMPAVGQRVRDKRKYQMIATIDSLIENGRFAFDRNSGMITAPLG